MSGITKEAISTPRIGMLTTIRNRRGIVSSVEPFETPDGQLHLVRLEYIDADGVPDDTVLWERELNVTLLEPTALPRVATQGAMSAAEFDALQRAARWSALSPYLLGEDAPQTLRTPIAAPLFGAIQAEDFQLVPLLKALNMPRVSLLLADDVGLGKTIEAGLILTELLLRRRIRRVLILCPASLRTQWKGEMHDKFALDFEVIDRAETHALQKRLGLDANPWRTYPRIITSYYYLRQPDVLEQFRAACRQPENSVQLPWDLLIVDEAHNLTPANFGEDSDLSKMLRAISPWFEHKLFLTATPHNGHTRCFSGLLEQLDPVRFTQTSEFSDADRRRVEEVVVRRLKRDINSLDEGAGRTPRFSQRIPEPLPLYFDRRERLLSIRFQEFRSAVKQLIREASRADQLAGSFAVEVLNKRLLSSPVTFADSWWRFKQGIAQEDAAQSAEVRAVRRSVEEELDDDREAEGRIQHAAKTVGAWLKPLADRLQNEIAALDETLTRLELTAPASPDNVRSFPAEDARWERFMQLIQDRLRDGDEWLPTERLIIFTEYKTTLDYLVRRLQEHFADESGRMRMLFGGMDDRERETIKQAFNDSTDPVRILVATDAASEGLNLQETARFVLHYDIPFNPARLDQRNGRLDRHGQARDVIVFHFTSHDDADLRFLSHVVEKVNVIREELGSMGEVFDAAFERQFSFLDDADSIVEDLDAAIAQRQGNTQLPTTQIVEMSAEQEALDWLAQEIDLTPQTLAQTLEQAMGIGVGLPRFDFDDVGRARLRSPIPHQWEALIDDTLRLPLPSTGNGHRRTRSRNAEQLGALPALTFDPGYYIDCSRGRPVFRSVKDTVLLHLGHPLYHKALALFARARFPGGPTASTPSRWTVRHGDVPQGADGLLLLTVEELAVNELRESFHHWVRTVRIPIINESLGSPLPHLPAALDRAAANSNHHVDEAIVDHARELWDAVEFAVRNLLKTMAEQLTTDLTESLKATRKTTQQEEDRRFANRIREVERAMRETTLQKLEKERDQIEDERSDLLRQPALFTDLQEVQSQRIREIDRRQQDIEAELERRREHYEDLVKQLKLEKIRVVERILPRRYLLRGEAQVFPVTVEIRLPPSA